MIFRKDINGLRAIAVIAVVLFHFNESWLPGGFAGVDIFFVISGYLMTRIIFSGYENKKFSIINFYISRANRIIPALTVLCLFLILFGWFYLAPIEYRALGKHVLGSLGFFSNIVYWKESGYFDAGSHAKWLLHTWSLSIEWQFYMVYPVIISILLKFFRVKIVGRLIALSAVLSFAFCVTSASGSLSASYYLLPSRSWQMFLGGLAFIYPWSIDRTLKPYVLAFGLLSILTTYFLVSKNTPWPGYLAFIPAFGAFVIMQVRSDNYIINNYIFQKIGEWSYSIYLWHWPIVVFFYRYSVDKSFIPLGLMLSVLFGFISYKAIEKNVYFKYSDNYFHILKNKYVYVVLAVSFIGGAIFYTGGFNIDQRYGASTLQAKFLNSYEDAHKNIHDVYWLKCNSYTSLTENNTLEIAPECIDGEKGSGGVFLWGDSHAEGLSYGLRSILNPLKIHFHQKTSAGCKASLYEHHFGRADFIKSCNSSNKLALESVKKIIPDIVIFAQANSHEDTDWDEISEKIKSFGVKRIFIIGPVSQWQPSLPMVMVKPKNWRSGDEYINDEGLDDKVFKTNNIMMSRNFAEGVTYFPIVNNICFIKEKLKYCRVSVSGGKLIQIDSGHLSKEGSVYIVSIFEKAILDALMH